MADTNSTGSEKDEVSNSPVMKALARHFVRYPLVKNVSRNHTAEGPPGNASFENEEKELHYNKNAGFSIAY